MADFWIIVANAATSAAIVSIATWWIKVYLDKRIQHQFAILLEEHKLALAKQLSAYSAHAAGVTARRLDAVMIAYRHMSKAYRTLRTIIKPFQIMPTDPAQVSEFELQRRKAFVDEMNAFIDALNDSEPLIPRELVDEMQSLNEEIHRVWNLGVQFREVAGGDKAQMKAWEIVEQKWPTLRARVDEYVRRFFEVDTATSARSTARTHGDLSLESYEVQPEIAAL